SEGWRETVSRKPQSQRVWESWALGKQNRPTHLMSRRGEPLRLHANDVIPACGDIDSCAHAPCQSKTPISHWTAGRFCDGCLGGGRGRHESGSPSFSNYRFGEPSEKKPVSRES